MLLLIFEGLGTSELILILVVALVLFGPRKLPQLSRSLGKSLANFKRASDDFKHTWEKEVARESAIKEALIGDSMLSEDRSILGESRHRSQAVLEASDLDSTDSSTSLSLPNPEGDSNEVATEPSEPVDVSEGSSTRKRDWL